MNENRSARLMGRASNAIDESHLLDLKIGDRVEVDNFLINGRANHGMQGTVVAKCNVKNLENNVLVRFDKEIDRALPSSKKDFKKYFNYDLTHDDEYHVDELHPKSDAVRLIK